MPVTSLTTIMTRQGAAGLDEVARRIGQRFARAEPRRRALASQGDAGDPPPPRFYDMARREP